MTNRPVLVFVWMAFLPSAFMECLNPRFSFLSSPSTSTWRCGGGRWGYNPRHRKSQQHDNKSKCALNTLVSAYLTLRIDELRNHKNVSHFWASVACKLTRTRQWWNVSYQQNIKDEMFAYITHSCTTCIKCAQYLEEREKITSLHSRF
jgi:hypothetical protein